jgi:8-oxo-dGTP pyrophosphatase MutT (NUDIX family)/GNAT superfamily N-acetyltransferase
MKKKKVLVYIVRKDGARLELLVFRHRDFPEAGLQVPAGSVDEGEALEAAARRETIEETGLKLPGNPIFIGRFDYHRSDIAEDQERNIFYSFVASTPNDQWAHCVSGGGEDHDLKFECHWEPIDKCEIGLAGDQGRYLHFIYRKLAADIKIRIAVPGDEPAIHSAHMRSIREVCVKDHGQEEIRGWGYRPLENRWIEPIKSGIVWVVERLDEIQGVGYLRIIEKDEQSHAYLHALYLTPDVIGQGLGYQLATMMLDTAKNLCASSIRLDSSITAKNFYKRIGFTEAGDMRQLEIGGYPVTTFPMEMDLK